MNKVFTLIISLLFLSGCVSTQTKDIFLKEKITDKKELAMSGSRAPWIYEIERRLRKNGFKIKRMASQNSSIERVSSTKTDIYNEASSRYILRIDGYASNTSMTRCFGGGYNFNYINAELIDIRKNETVLHFSDSGYSEGCPPLSGTIFGDISQIVTEAWK